MTTSITGDTRPNILLVVSDQERHRGWLPADVELPHRDRLRREGLEFTRHYTHSSPCSPSRASLFTGRYLNNHGVLDNVITGEHHPLSTNVPTIGSVLRKAGYRSSYIGKWHLSFGSNPDMEAYGFSDWDGDDRHFMGWAGTGVHFDPIIASNAAHWLEKNARREEGDEPWFLTVALVNPHDVMWYPMDQPQYGKDHPEEAKLVRDLLSLAAWKEGDPLPLFNDAYPEVFDQLPENFHDDLFTKPDAHRAWRYDQQHSLYGYIDPKDKGAWLRQLDYYLRLHQLADESLGTVLGALERSGAKDDTVVIFTSDHGDMCGSHGLRSKGPFVYEEIMHVPLVVVAPGRTTPGTQTSSLSSHVDLASTIASIAQATPEHSSDHDGRPSFQGEDLTPIFENPAHVARDAILFAQDSAHTDNINQTRYALRGFFDGTTKYARYYGVGGGIPSPGLWGRPQGVKLFDVDAEYDDQDHELYDHANDPFELVNLANDPARRGDVLENFERLRRYEKQYFSTLSIDG